MLLNKMTEEVESVNHDRWLVSYADFITLLFAFFVVMYAISSVNEGKYKILSDSLEQVFNDDKKFTDEEKIKKNIAIEQPLGQQKEEKLAEKKLPEVSEVSDTQQLTKIYFELEKALKEFSADKKISITATQFWIEINMKSSLLFPSGIAEVNNEAFYLIESIAAIIDAYPNPIIVAGFTDNIPMKNNFYPSNWELSSARASAIVRLLVEFGVPSSNLSAVGYADAQPIGSNDTEEDRQKNRRVVIRIAKTPEESVKKIILTNE